MRSVGRGVQEIRIWDAAGTFRIIYVASLPDAVYVLHCFRKTTQKSPRADLELASVRLEALLNELNQ